MPRGSEDGHGDGEKMSLMHACYTSMPILPFSTTRDGDYSRAICLGAFTKRASGGTPRPTNSLVVDHCCHGGGAHH